MRLKSSSVTFVVMGVLAVVYYTVEPWAVTFLDDGPYYSTEYLGPIEELPLQSQVELRRFGLSVYFLESRLRAVNGESVLVLRDMDGFVKWVRLPVKSDGELGPIELRGARVTWYGGWRIAISPKNQEGGYLYLGSSGVFRFFNHSW
jgi:hypothetical protein